MKLSDQNKIDIVQGYLGGSSSVKLAKEFSVTRAAILGVLRVRGVEIRKMGGVK